MTDRSYAAIDLGSNSCRLLICDDKGCQLYAQNYSTRLAEGMGNNKHITPQAFSRAKEAFVLMRQKLDEYKVAQENLRAVTTAACRMAVNGQDFIDEMAAISKIELEIIDAKEEAELNLQGASEHVKGKTPYVIIWDIGGGSTEVTLAYNRAKPQIIKTVSIPYGARNASEQFNLKEYDEDKAANLRSEIGKYLDEFERGTDIPDVKDVSFVATSSTALRMAALIEKKQKYVRENEDGHIIDVKGLKDLIAELYNCSVEKMAQNDCIGETRASIFIAAVIIFEQIAQRVRADNITASLKSAKDAIIANLIERDKKHD